MLGRNVVANFLGYGWVAIMELLFVPIYIEQLGMAAYGFIGVFLALQAVLILLDMGMTPTINREMARFTSGQLSLSHIWQLLRSLEWLAISLGMFVFGMITILAGFLAKVWISHETLPNDTVILSLTIIGFVIGVRLVESIYRGALYGLQRQVVFNVAYSGLATLRGVGAVVILVFISPTITAFFLWQAFVSAISVVILMKMTYQIMPRKQYRVRASIAALKKVWTFARGVLAISVLATILLQADKLILSGLLSLDVFGVYTLAVLVASGLYKLTTPISQAWFPRMSELHALQDEKALRRTFHLGAQLMTIVVASVGISVVLFAEPILLLWTNDAILSASAAPLLSILMLGNILNAMMWIPYQAQLAHGLTSLAIYLNLAAVSILIPALVLLVPTYGVEAAAWIWVTLNVFYVSVGATAMYRLILQGEYSHWLLRDIFLPTSGAAVVILAALWLYPETVGRMTQIVYVGATVLLAGAASYLACVAAGDLFMPASRRQWKRKS